MSEHKIVQPENWPRAGGYSNGIVAHGTLVATSGQVGWNPVTMKFATTDFVEQVRVALENVVIVLRSAGAEPKHVIRMTWFITDRASYVDNAKRIGEVYREVFGRFYPTMSVAVVTALIEADAKVEIEATAVLPD